MTPERDLAAPFPLTEAWIVTGGQRGRVWAVSDVGAAPEEADFLEWARAWARTQA